MINSRKQKAMATKKRLLAAAEEVFLKYGFQKTKISQICHVANTAHGTAYVYFENKEDFLVELIKDIVDQFYEVATIPFHPSTENEAYELILHQVSQYLLLALKNKNRMRILKEGIGTSKRIECTWQGIREQFIERITIDIRYAQQQSLANPNLIPALVARSWYYTNEMFMWDLVSNNISYDKDDIIKHMTIIYTNGLYTQPHH